MDDVLIRTLRHAGFTVKFVQNVTDVGHLSSDSDTGEDKLEKGAKKYGKSVWDIAHEFEEYFWKSMDAMGNIRPDISCRATEHIPAQLEMVKKLEQKGFAYVIAGDGVYFDTSKFPDYPNLSRMKMDELEAGARIEVVAGKRHPTDFALWKFERPGENRAMVWPSPWAERSFPGWHIECSAMAVQYLGEQFDIHTGGIDHIPIHHTNEIAQAEAASGKKPFVKYWVHHNFLRVDGEKMSKSLGNFFTIDDVLKRKFSPAALRLLFLTTHYRSELNFTWTTLEGMQKTYDRLVRQLKDAHDEGGRTVLSPEKQKEIDAFRDKFVALIDDDLNTPEAVVLVWSVMKSNIPSMDKFDLLMDFDEVLGLGLRQAVEKLESSDQTKTVPHSPEVQRLLAERVAARDAKDYQKADALRAQLATLGVAVTDKKE
jgi:cysteinyl-tRNA synthetase